MTVFKRKRSWYRKLINSDKWYSSIFERQNDFACSFVFNLQVSKTVKPLPKLKLFFSYAQLPENRNPNPQGQSVSSVY